MSLYTDWSNMVVNYVKEHGEEAFWNEYGGIEKNVYSKLLGEQTTNLKGTVKALAEKYETPVIFFMGFLDGVNDSLTQTLDLEALTEDTEIDININHEKLYFNMLDAKADYLYDLPQWAGIFSKEKKKEIQRSWRESKVIVNEPKIGRNDPCPCGSGKKYKKCCGKDSK